LIVIAILGLVTWYGSQQPNYAGPIPSPKQPIFGSLLRGDTMTPLMADPVASYYVGDTIPTTSLTVKPTKALDEDYTDGTVNYLKHNVYTIKDGTVIGEMTPLWIGGFYDKPTNTLSLPMSGMKTDAVGNYMYTLVVVSAESKYANNAWGSYVYTQVGSASYAYKVIPKPFCPNGLTTQTESQTCTASNTCEGKQGRTCTNNVWTAWGTCTTTLNKCTDGTCKAICPPPIQPDWLSATALAVFNAFMNGLNALYHTIFG
jgi:hypothetical protein